MKKYKIETMEKVKGQKMDIITLSLAEQGDVEISEQRARCFLRVNLYDTEEEALESIRVNVKWLLLGNQILVINNVNREKQGKTI